LPNLRTPELFPTPTEFPILILDSPLLDITSKSDPDDFLIRSSEVGTAVPIPNLPVLNAVRAVPSDPTFNSVVAVTIPLADKLDDVT